MQEPNYCMSYRINQANRRYKILAVNYCYWKNIKTGVKSFALLSQKEKEHQFKIAVIDEEMQLLTSINKFLLFIKHATEINSDTPEPDTNNQDRHL